MKTERQLFLYELTGRGYEFRNKSWCDDWEIFEDDQLNMVWEMWCASASREGYKLVPIEPTSEMLEALNLGFKPDYEGGDYDSEIGYKALIEVVP